MTDERAWLKMGAEYLRHDSMEGVGVTPDDWDEVDGDDAPDDEEPLSDAELEALSIGEMLHPTAGLKEV